MRAKGPSGQCGATATSNALHPYQYTKSGRAETHSAMVAIRLVSLMPPACAISGWMMSTQPASWHGQ